MNSLLYLHTLQEMTINEVTYTTIGASFWDCAINVTIIYFKLV